MTVPAAEFQGTLILAAFLSATILLDWVSIALPRGDEIVVSGGIVSATLLCVGAPEALFVSVASVLILSLTPHRKTLLATAETVLVRSVSVLAGYLGLVFLRYASAASAMAVGTLLVPTLLLLTELIARQLILSIHSSRPLSRLISGNFRRGFMLVAAQISAAALIAVTYESMGVWSLVPVVPLLILIRQSYSLLLEIRETYRTTLSVLVEAAEGDDAAWMGHGRRTAAIARAVGARCGLSSTELDWTGYAALLHDIDRIAVDSAEPCASNTTSAEMLRDIAFLSNVVPVLRVMDDPDVPSLPERVQLMGFIVALASEIDVLQTPRLPDRHPLADVSRVSTSTPLRIKARAVSAALELGYGVPAID